MFLREEYERSQAQGYSSLNKTIPSESQHSDSLPKPSRHETVFAIWFRVFWMGLGESEF